MSFEKLFEPIQIGDVEIKNRIAMAPMNMVYADPEGYVSEQNLAWYAARAKGGFGLIIIECTVVNPQTWRGSDHLNALRFTDMNYGRKLGELADNIHAFGAKVFLQLSPGFGRQGHGDHETHAPSAAPSAVPYKIDLRKLNKGWERQVKRLAPKIIEMLGGFDTIRNMDDEQYAGFEENLEGILKKEAPPLVEVWKGQVPRELTRDEIVMMEDKMAEMTEAALFYGFDGVEIHSPHGYLIHQFMSPRSNKRTDEYGGDLENRGRFLRNIITKTRERIGPDKPLCARFSGDELMPEGVTNEEAKQFVAMAVEAGVNCINISQGCYENPGAFAPDGEGEMAEWGPGFIEAGKAPVIAPNFMTPEAAEAALKDKKVDVVALGRQAIADPFWPAKVKSDRLKDIVKCARCNNCYMNLFEHRKLSCIMNPTAGFEKYLPELWRTNAPPVSGKMQKFLDKAEGLPQI